MKIIKQVWIITDRNRKLIATGVPRNRYLKMIGDDNGGSLRQRILTYDSKGRAQAGYNGSWFYTSRDVDDYLRDTYNYGVMGVGDKWERLSANPEDFMQALEATMTFEVEDLLF